VPGARHAKPAASFDGDLPDLSSFGIPSSRGGFGDNADARGGGEEYDDDDDGGSAYADSDEEGEGEEEEEEEEEASSSGSFRLRMDKSTLSVLRRWSNFANGVLLLVLGPITFAISAASFSVDKMILSLYIS
jgi:hypothetical protein